MTARKGNIIVVDVQPEYKDHISFDTSRFFSYLNRVLARSNRRVCFLYNGADTLGMISEHDLIEMYQEYGFEWAHDGRVSFYDKGYAFFRYCMDSGIDNEDIAILLKFMIDNDINDSRDLKRHDLWDEFMAVYNKQELRDLLEVSGDCISIPDVMEHIKKYGKNIELCGGGLSECLNEIEIALMVNKQTYKLNHDWTY